MARRAPVIVVSERQQRVLDKLDRGGKTPQRVVPRVRIVKLSAEGLPNKDQAAKLGVGHEAVGRWRQRRPRLVERLEYEYVRHGRCA